MFLACLVNEPSSNTPKLALTCLQPYNIDRVKENTFFNFNSRGNSFLH